MLLRNCNYRYVFSFRQVLKKFTLNQFCFQLTKNLLRNELTYTCHVMINEINRCEICYAFTQNDQSAGG